MAKVLIATLIVGLAIVLVAGTWWGWRMLVVPIGGSPTDSTFKVHAGDGARAIAARLEEGGFIRSQLAVLAYLRLSGEQFVEGIYSLNRAGSSLQNIEPVLTGTVAERQVTIPEGLRVHEVAQLLEREAVLTADDFVAAARSNPSLIELPTSYNLKADTFLEGFIFPDTYRVPAEATGADLVQRFVQNYLKRTASLTLTYEQLILASIVEREAKLDEDRPLIAGVYANRLKLDLSLQADPTVQYGKANQLNGCPDDMKRGCVTPKSAADGGEPRHSVAEGEGWWPTLTVADYQGVESEYNTYRHAGLPPRPIANPGLKSIEAAANPVEHDYLFFVHDAQGKAHFAKTLDEHNRNKAQYLR